MRLGRVRLLAGIATITTLAGVLAATAMSSANATTAAPVALKASAASPLPAGATRIGAVPAATEIKVDVALNLGNQAGLTALLNGLANPNSPYFRDFVPAGKFGSLFGLSLSEIAAVRAELSALGLNPGQADSGRTVIPVTATAAQLEHAFGTTLVNYRLPGGRVAYANLTAPVVPAVIAPYVQGVVGLDNVYEAQHASQQLTTAVAGARTASARTATSASAASAPGTEKAYGPFAAPAPRDALPAAPASPAASGAKPCAAATDDAVNLDGFTANQFAQHYGMNYLYGYNDLGQNTHVAVAELEPNLATDIAAYEACYGIATPVSYINVDGGAGTGMGSGEAALDIENIAGLAPDAIIDDYEAPNAAATSLLDIVTDVANRDTDKVLSVSWGLCEANANDALLNAFLTQYEKLNAEGITAVGAAGDYGPAGCYEPSAPSATVSAVSPASTPYGLSVGGTTMTSATELSTETAWNEVTTTAIPGGAGGGGNSDFCMPAYQDYLNHSLPLGLLSNYSKKGTGCGGNGYLRETPDVSADASGTAPYVIYYDGAWTGFYGTSASTSLVAAEAALIDNSPFCSSNGWNSGKIGMLPQGLYAQTSIDSNFIYLGDEGILADIKTGNTAYAASGSPAGLYPATKGYDLASGLGAPLLTGEGLPMAAPGMASVMCHWYAQKSLVKVSTTGIAPGAGKAGKKITVTVHGTGLLAVPYTVIAEVNTNRDTKQVTDVWASCSSHTTCKVTIPGEKAGTYQIELIAADYLPCTNGCKVFATFIFSGPPKITKMSPTKGGKGTKVTIHGANFYGVSAVYFGGKKATKVKVVSATEITAYVPAGSGSVKVKVVAAGGTSNQLKYTY
jgi:Pro-kumamolisin, activation domain/IPT/TIG domain